IQSAAAIQTKEWMRACFREGVVPLLQMHDSLDLSVSSPETAEMVAQLGEEAIKLEVPMKVDVTYARTWAAPNPTWNELHASTTEAPSIEVPINDAPDTEPPPWEDNGTPAPWETPLAAAAGTIETPPPVDPPRICIHCHRDPPDGSERVSAYDGAY